MTCLMTTHNHSDHSSPDSRRASRDQSMHKTVGWLFEKALRDKHKLGQSKQDSLYFQLWDKVQPFIN